MQESHSRKPWSTRGVELVDADGNSIALFKDYRDAAEVAEMEALIATMQTKINEAMAALENLADE